MSQDKEVIKIADIDSSYDFKESLREVAKINY